MVDTVFTERLRRGKHPPLFTDTEANNCFSIQHKFNSNSQIATVLYFLIKWVSHNIFFLRKPPRGEYHLIF